MGYYNFIPDEYDVLQMEFTVSEDKADEDKAVF